MINVSFNLSEVTMDELIGLQAMLTAYDRAALGTQIKAKQFEVLTPLGEPNARMRPSVQFNSAALDMADHLGVAPLPDGPVQPEFPLFAGCPETPQTGRPEPAVAPQATEPVIAQPEPAAAPEPVQGYVPAEPMVPKRKRRTKEQMEADEMAAQATMKNPDEKLSAQSTATATHETATPVATAAQAPATTPAQAAAGTPAQGAPVGAPTNPEPTGDDLRAALKVYAKVHGMPKAIELIKDFGCERISELETRPITDRLEFMKLASNA